jgi:ribonuclease Z
MDLSLFFTGTAGSVPSARRGLPGVLLRRGGDKLLFDCGEGTQRQLLRTVGLPDMSTIFLTHLHTDHWLGVLGMLRTLDLRDREAPLTIYGPSGTSALMSAMRRIYGKVCYPLTIEDLEPDEVIGYSGFEVQTFNVRHRGACFGYSFVEHPRPGRFDDDLALSLGIEFGPDFGRLQAGETVNGITPDQVIGPERAGRRITISGDTTPCDAVVAAAHGADVLIHEATFSDEELERASETGHSTARQAAEIAAEAGVKLLGLTHISNRYGGRELRDEARAAFANSYVLRDFDTIELPFAEKGEPEIQRWDGNQPARDAAPTSN